MTDPEPLEGTHENGERAELVAPFHTGPAGLRTMGDGTVEIAYFDKPPRDFSGEATFDGKAITISAAREGSVRGMTVLSATIVESDQALRQ